MSRPSNTPQTTQLEELAVQVERLVEQIAVLQARIAGSDDELVSLRNRLSASQSNEANISATLDRTKLRQRTMQEEIIALRQATDETDVLRGWLSRLTDTEAILEFALAENDSLAQQLKFSASNAEQSADEVIKLERTLRGVQAELEELGEQERERRRAAQPRVAPQGGVRGFLGIVFGRLKFVQDSIEVLANFESPVAVMRALVQLDMGEMLGKDLVGLRGWREVSKIATGISGSEDMGRLYYKPDGDRVLVSVHIKRDNKEQRRHVERLRSL